MKNFQDILTFILNFTIGYILSSIWILQNEDYIKLIPLVLIIISIKLTIKNNQQK